MTQTSSPPASRDHVIRHIRSPMRVYLGSPMRGPLRGFVRPVLLFAVPALLLAAAVWVYLGFGRYATTDDAYVKADLAMVAPQVGGNVLAIHVQENERVVEGQVLLDIDDEAVQFAVRQAQAQVEAARIKIEALKANHVMQSAEVVLAEDQAKFAQTELDRQSNLSSQSLVSKADLDKAQKNYDLMHGMALIVRAQMHGTAIQLQGDPELAVDEHPEVRAALVELERAWRNLEYTHLVAPRGGIVSRLPFVGDRVTAGVPVLAIVDDGNEWIEANFKETDLERMHPGQPVEIEIDTFPDWHGKGKVESVAQASGAEFALLPPQNASGNWVKVVQRIAVRISIEHEAPAPELRVGMSAFVRVDLGTANKGAGSSPEH